MLKGVFEAHFLKIYHKNKFIYGYIYTDIYYLYITFLGLKFNEFFENVQLHIYKKQREHVHQKSALF